MRRLVKNQRAVNDQIRTENCFYRIQQLLVRGQPVSPGKEQMQVIEPATITIATNLRHLLERIAIMSCFCRRQNTNRKQQPVMCVSLN